MINIFVYYCDSFNPIHQGSKSGTGTIIYLVQVK